ncbi:MAG: hypothetical protein J0M08_07680 [Bacteroidetes bacterium]|nr:hypothetical protein [Bacteroidota bacterium]
MEKKIKQKTMMNRLIIIFHLLITQGFLHAQKTKTHIFSNEISYYKKLDPVLFNTVDSILKTYKEVNTNDTSYPIRINNVISSVQPKTIGKYPDDYFNSGIFLFAINSSHSTDYILIRDQNKEIRFIAYFDFSNLIQAYLEYIKMNSSLTKTEKLKYFDCIKEYLELYGEDKSGF